MKSFLAKLLAGYAERFLAAWVVTLRSTKGSALTHAEVDANFTTLRDVAAQTSGTISGLTSLGVTGDTTLTGDLAVNGGDLTSSATTFNLLATPTTVNAFAGASVALNIGHASAAAAFPGGITIPTGKTLSGAGAINITGAISGTTGTFSTAINGLVLDPGAGASKRANVFYKGTNGASGDTFWSVGVNVASTDGSFDVYNGPLGLNQMNLPVAGGATVTSSGVDIITSTNSASGGYNYVSNAPSNGGTYYHAKFVDGATSHGSITSNGTNTAYNTSSDQRLKKDLGVAVDLSVLRNTVIHDFEWKSDGSRDRGVFAQEAAITKPRAITHDKDADSWMADYSKYVSDLIVGWKNHEARLAALEAK